MGDFSCFSLKQHGDESASTTALRRFPFYSFSLLLTFGAFLRLFELLPETTRFFDRTNGSGRFRHLRMYEYIGQTAVLSRLGVEGEHKKRDEKKWKTQRKIERKCQELNPRGNIKHVPEDIQCPTQEVPIFRTRINPSRISILVSRQKAAVQWWH